jgi:hypothetical protein
MTKKKRNRKNYKSKLERQEIGRQAGLRGAAMQRAKYDRFALNRMKRERAARNWLAERMARDAD